MVVGMMNIGVMRLPAGPLEEGTCLYPSSVCCPPRWLWSGIWRPMVWTHAQWLPPCSSDARLAPLSLQPLGPRTACRSRSRGTRSTTSAGCCLVSIPSEEAETLTSLGENLPTPCTWPYGFYQPARGGANVWTRPFGPKFIVPSRSTLFISIVGTQAAGHLQGFLQVWPLLLVMKLQNWFCSADEETDPRGSVPCPEIVSYWRLQLGSELGFVRLTARAFDMLAVEPSSLNQLWGRTASSLASVQAIFCISAWVSFLNKRAYVTPPPSYFCLFSGSETRPSQALAVGFLLCPRYTAHIHTAPPGVPPTASSAWP